MPPVSQQVKDRFAQLVVQGAAIPTEITRSGSEVSKGPEFHAWAASALNLVLGVFGRGSPHYEHLESAIGKVKDEHPTVQRINACRGVLNGAKSDVDNGMLFQLEATFTGEVFGDFVTSAKAALAEGHHLVAAVLASAALEDALKRFSMMNGLDTNGKTMEEVINGLKTKGLVGGPTKSLLESMPKIRNSAMHANWDKLTPEQAGSVIGFTEQFLLRHF